MRFLIGVTTGVTLGITDAILNHIERLLNLELDPEDTTNS